MKRRVIAFELLSGCLEYILWLSYFYLLDFIRRINICRDQFSSTVLTPAKQVALPPAKSTYKQVFSVEDSGAGSMGVWE